jgi:pilus assembly protein CpaE
VDERKLNKLLSQARKAYKKKDKRKGAQLVNEILKEDFMHAGTWQLLYQLYGSDKPFDEFQRSFTEQYYPDRLADLDSNLGSSHEGSTTSTTEEEPDTSKGSFFGRIFGGKRSTRNIEQTQQKPVLEDRDPGHPASSAAAETEPGFDSTRKSPAQTSSSQSLLQNATHSSVSPTPAHSSRAAPNMPKIKPVTPIPKRPGDKISVIVVDDITQTRENIVRSLRFQEDIEVIGTASNGAEAIQISKELQPDVILMDVNMPDMDGITATTNIKRLVPFSQVVILTVQDDVDYIRRAMMAGARDFLSKPPTIDELVAAVQRAGEFAFQERQKSTSIDEALASGLLASKGKIITIYSPKGGAGSTMFASNLAAAFYNDETAVALIDGDLQFGDVSVFYNAQSRNSTLDLTRRVNELDSELVEEVLYQHISGIRILPPPRPEEAEYVSSDQFSSVLEYLRDLFPYIIVDTSHDLTNTTLSALDVCDVIVLITTQDIPSIARTRRFLDFLRLIEVDKRKALLVINQYDKRIGVSSDKVSQALGIEVSAVLPVEKETVIPSINRGSPFMLQNEKVTRPIAKEILTAVEKIREKITQIEQAKQTSEEDQEKKPA